jgi:hypothetical protein
MLSWRVVRTDAYLAPARYMYFAGLVKESVGAT